LHRNCLLKHIIEGKIEEITGVTGRRARRRKQLLDDLKNARRCCKVKEEALDRTVWRTRFGRGCVVMMMMMMMIMMVHRGIEGLKAYLLVVLIT
jgi:hypothetical protein